MVTSPSHFTHLSDSHNRDHVYYMYSVVRPNIVTRVGACHSACHRPSDAGGQSLSEDHTQQYIAFLYHSVSNCGHSTILLQSHEGASASNTLIGSNNHQSAQPRTRSLPRQSCQGHGVQWGESTCNLKQRNQTKYQQTTNTRKHTTAWRPAE